MPVGWYSDWVMFSAATAPTPARPKVGRPDRGNRAKVKAGRKAAKRR